MKRTILFLFSLLISLAVDAVATKCFPTISEKEVAGYFPLSRAAVYIDADDYKVVNIAASMLADDVERVTGSKPVMGSARSFKKLSKGSFVVAGTIGHSRLIDELIKKKAIEVSAIKGKWESYLITTIMNPKTDVSMLVIAGSDRRGTAFGLTSLSEAIGVSPWYWWDDVMPLYKKALYVEPGSFVQGEPSVQYRGIFINDECPQDMGV